MKREVVELLDDLDGGPADETVSFAFDGRSYVIDLSAENAEEFRALLDVYAKAGRRDDRDRAGKPGHGREPFAEVDQRAVRKWAASRGVKVSPRGRLPRSVVEQYRSAGH